jgi:cell division protease FtsH
MPTRMPKRVLNENIDILHRLAELLLEKETVLGKELDDLIHSLRPGIELPSSPPGKDRQAEENPTDGNRETRKVILRRKHENICPGMGAAPF